MRLHARDYTHIVAHLLTYKGYALTRLGAAKPRFFVVMDLTSGYWQTEVHKDSRVCRFYTP
jgi:hypothetical protein